MSTGCRKPAGSRTDLDPPGRAATILRHVCPGHPWSKNPREATEAILAAQPEAVSAARRLARNAVAKWGLADEGGAIAMVLSELTTNAIRATTRTGQGDQILVRVSHTGPIVLVQVGDHCPRPPAPPKAPGGQLAEHGRGLAIAAALSGQLGWYRDQAGWKIVWALIAVPAPPPMRICCHRHDRTATPQRRPA